MKFAISTICFLSAIAIYVNAELTPEQIEQLTKAAEVCKPKTGASDADIDTLMNHEIPETKAGLCFAACMIKSCGSMSADNKIDVAKMKEMAAPLKEKDAAKYEKGMKVVETCAPQANTESDECDVAKKMMECSKKESAALGLTLKDIMEN